MVLGLAIQKTGIAERLALGIIGSPTHMMVYAPGGYRFSDFMRIGLLMNLIILAANVFIVNIVYPIMPLQ